MGEQEESKQSPSHESTAGAMSLNRRYLYQNPTTGTVSSTTLTVRQLCRMACPPTNAPSRFNSDTQVLALLEEDGPSVDNGAATDTPMYDPAGWKPAKEIPILKHATCPAFYYTMVVADSTDSASQQQQQGGPVSCRQLSEIILKSPSNYLQKKSQFYGESTGNQWITFQAMPDLELALQAFRDAVVPVPQSASIVTTLDDTTTTSKVQPQEYDPSVMVFDNNLDNPPYQDGHDMDGENNGSNDNGKKREHEIQDELESFLSSTDHMGPIGQSMGLGNGGGDNSDEDDEGYESDGGTKYVKDPRTGNWIHQALAPPRPKSDSKSKQQPPSKKPRTQHNSNNDANTNDNVPKKKSKKAKFAARNAKCWIYVTGLPPDTDEEEVGKFFTKVGIIDLDPETQRPKVKVYRHTTDTKDPKTSKIVKKGTCKGDASICYARPESVELALQVLDEAPFRDNFAGGMCNGNSNDKDPHKVHVERAKFEQRGDYAQQKDKKKRISQMQRKVAKLAAKQAMDWDDGETNGRLTGGVKGLRIIVLKGMFHPSELSAADDDEDTFLSELERTVRSACEDHGVVEKITVFSKNPRGIVVVKFTQPGSASEAIKAWDGKSFGLRKQKRKVEAIFWDGVEDYTVRDEEKEREETEKRLDEFGAWLDGQTNEDLPEELRLKVEE